MVVLSWRSVYVSVSLFLNPFALLNEPPSRTSMWGFILNTWHGTNNNTAAKLTNQCQLREGLICAVFQKDLLILDCGYNCFACMHVQHCVSTEDRRRRWILWHWNCRCCGPGTGNWTRILHKSTKCSYRFNIFPGSLPVSSTLIPLRNL